MEKMIVLSSGYSLAMLLIAAAWATLISYGVWRMWREVVALRNELHHEEARAWARRRRFDERLARFAQELQRGNENG